MARGRMLNKKISLSKQVADLCARAGIAGGFIYTWMIAHLDVEGRMHGDPDVIKATVFPRISGIDPDQIRRTSDIATALGLLDVYESSGDIYISYPGFEANQVGLRKKREPPSEIPPPSGIVPADFRQTSGNDPEECGQREGKGREEKRKEGKTREHAAPSSSTVEGFAEIVADWGWQIVLSPKQSVLAQALVPISAEELANAKAKTEAAEGKPNAGLLLSIIERERKAAETAVNPESEAARARAGEHKQRRAERTKSKSTEERVPLEKIKAALGVENLSDVVAGVDGGEQE